MKFYLDEQQIIRTKAEELVGRERLRRMVAEAKESDPLEEHSWWIGRGQLTIELN